MNLTGRETSERVGDGFVGDRPGLIQRFPLHHQGRHAGCGDGSPAPEGKEAGSDDSIGFDLDEEPQRVPADGVDSFSHSASVFHLAHVSGVTEVVQNMGTVTCRCLGHAHPS